LPSGLSRWKIWIPSVALTSMNSESTSIYLYSFNCTYDHHFACITQLQPVGTLIKERLLRIHRGWGDLGHKVQKTSSMHFIKTMKVLLFLCLHSCWICSELPWGKRGNMK
jgi:hypothetical protein